MFATLFALRYLSGDVALKYTWGLNNLSPFGVDQTAVNLTIFSLFCVWATLASYVLLATYPFFKKDVKSLTPLVKFFATTVSVVNLATLSIQLTALGGKEATQSVGTLGIFFSLELGVALAMCAIVWVKNYKTSFSLKSMAKPLLIAAGMMLASIPAYALQVLVGPGPTTLLLNDFNLEHRLALYAAFLIPVAIIAIFLKCSYQQKRYALLYIALATMTTYSNDYTFTIFTNVLHWPLHLCNTAMFVVPLCLMFKWNKLFYFTLFINVLGALFAMLMPNYSDTTLIFSYTGMQFWINHYCAFFMPILIIALGLYERPKWKLFVYSLVAFCIYYVFVLIMNAWLTNYDSGVDFFFINSDFIAEKLGQWAEDLRKITVTIPLKDGMKMILYPVYQTLYFLVYIALSFAMWFIYELCFQTVDAYVELWNKNRKIHADRLALEVSLAGRKISEPLNMEGTNKLVLKNFTKKYATSDMYAVYNANLEIEGGQIFGFLGPNGAGKSTIIKSIVGIQSITSGAIEVCGYDVDKQSVDAKLQIGFVPDHYALYENLTGREYVNYIADLYNVSEEDRHKRIEEYVERFRLQGSFDNPIKTYSHGMKQKITIMSALVHSPKLWILDEPLTGLDPESIFQVKEAMKKHAQEGNIVFFSSHIIDVVERICDRIAIIKKGRILCSRDVKELEAEGVQLEDFYMNMIENADDNSVSAINPPTEELVHG